MSIRQFIRENREEITELTGATNDEDRKLWVLNDEGLYNWAKSLGVRV